MICEETSQRLFSFLNEIFVFLIPSFQKSELVTSRPTISLISIGEMLQPLARAQCAPMGFHYSGILPQVIRACARSRHVASMDRACALIRGLLFSACLFSLMRILPISGVMAYEEEWIPFVPRSSQVSFDFREEDGASYIEVSICFWDAGFQVTDWGTPIVKNDTVTVDTRMLRWTGPSAQVITNEHHTYQVADMPSTATFVFKTWGHRVKDSTVVMIPEFTSNVIILLFILAASLAALRYRKKW
jgi:hypothetical protein